MALNQYRQSASQVLAAGVNGPLAGGDVNILAKDVRLEEAYNTSSSYSVQRSGSTPLGGSAQVSFGGANVSTTASASRPPARSPPSRPSARPTKSAPRL